MHLIDGTVFCSDDNPKALVDRLKISGNQRAAQEIISHIVLAQMKDPEIAKTCDLDDVSFTLGEPVFHQGSMPYGIPVSVYARKSS